MKDKPHECIMYQLAFGAYPVNKEMQYFQEVLNAVPGNDGHHKEMDGTPSG